MRLEAPRCPGLLTLNSLHRFCLKRLLSVDSRFTQIEQVKIAQNTRLLFKPFSILQHSSAFRAINSSCLRCKGVQSAYLSRCKLPSESTPRNVIVIGVQEGQCFASLARKLMLALEGVVLDGAPIDVLPMRSCSIPAAVIETGLRVA